ncbi:MAG: BamA/TamA family outer membrane protein [Candidatus Zixiibacteriota bacterium]
MCDRIIFMKWSAAVIAVLCLAGGGVAYAQGYAGDDAFTLKNIDVDGNKHFKDKAIRDLLGVEKGEVYERYLFDYLLEQGIAAVEKAYTSEGYHDARVRWAFRGVKEGERKLQVRVDEGPRAEITDILLDGVAPERYLDVRENLGVDVGSPLSAKLLSDAALKIGRYYSDLGYARASATLKIDRDTGVVTFAVTEGRVYHVGEIVVAGNEKTRPKIISREIEYKIKPDRLWRGSKIDESRANIYRTGLYRDLRVEAVESPRSADLVDVLVIVREDKFRWYKLEPGYESPDRASFTVGWGHNNVFGNNQRFSAETSIAYGFATEESDFGVELTYTEPWLFGYRLRGSSTVYYDREIDHKKTGVHERLWAVGLEPRITREITDDLEVSGGFRFKRYKRDIELAVGDRNVASPLWEGGLAQRYLKDQGLENIASFIFSSTYSTRDDIFNPLSGFYLSGSEETAGGLLPGVDFWRVIVDGRQYLQVGEAATMAARVRGGYARAYGATKDVPYGEKFFAGGAYSVRGYGEEEVGPTVFLQGEEYSAGGNVLFVGNAELRFQLPFTAGRRVPGVGLNLGNLWAGLFADTGNVWADWASANEGRLFYGAGFGLRYNTPVGPIRFDYGRAIMEKTKEKTSGRFYLAFGHIF